MTRVSVSMACLLAVLMVVGVMTVGANAAGKGSGGVIYVTSQGLFYDTLGAADPLPPHGPFQKLEMGGPADAQTEFGPGDVGYLGGRWWVDENGNGQMDEGDHYFECPLLGPGREEP